MGWSPAALSYYECGVRDGMFDRCVLAAHVLTNQSMMHAEWRVPARDGSRPGRRSGWRSRRKKAAISLLVSGQQYSQLFTMHGAIMLPLFATPLFVGFTNEIMPLQIGALVFTIQIV